MMNKFDNNGEKFIMGRNIIRTMEELADTIKAVIEVWGKGEYEVQVQKITKNNDTHLTGIVIKNKNSNLAPAIYLEDYFEQYQRGVSLRNICEQILQVYNKHKVMVDFDTTLVTDFNKVKSRICYKLINAEKNKEMLADTPYMKFHDLAIIFYIVLLKDSEETAGIMVKNHLMEYWNVEKQEIFELAVKNTPRLFQGEIIPMMDIVRKIIETRQEDDEIQILKDMLPNENKGIPMYICTNKERREGAGVIFYKGVLETFADLIDNDFYILPSSTHEVIFIPAFEDTDINQLKDMVREVNTTQVEPEEFLSNNVYFYNRRTDRVEMV